MARRSIPTCSGGELALSLFVSEDSVLDGGAAYLRWAMGCADDMLELDCQVHTIPEPLPAACAPSPLGRVVLARVRRRRGA
jgi:hypothetical protein